MRRALLSTALILSAACSDSEPQAAPASQQAEPDSERAGSTPERTSSAGSTAAGARAPSGSAPRDGQAGQTAPNTAAGSGGGAPATSTTDAGATTDDGEDNDAGPAPDSTTDVTIIAQASFAPVTLTVDGASCAAGRCSIAAPADGMLRVALTVERTGNQPMPVLARWQGCGTPTTQFFPVTPSSTDYILNYETQFSELRAGSVCTAEIVEGGWLVFAGNMSLQVLEGSAFCTTLQVSAQGGFNASCFPPPGTQIAIESDLPRWDCVEVTADAMIRDVSYMQTRLSLTSMANQLISCTGATQ
jgi:hypothetical protein